MSKLWDMDVEKFNKAIGTPRPSTPQWPSEDSLNLGYDLVVEELIELQDAIDERNLPKAVDGIVDSIYVLIGLAYRMGVHLHPCFEAVHKANMAKLSGPKREDGKQLKPDGWVPPDIETILRKAGWDGR